MKVKTMQTWELTYPENVTPDDLPTTVAAFGFFDGIHQGHQAVITHAVNLAKAENKESAVFTFHPHPSVVLKQSTEDVKYITTMEEKKAFIASLGVDRLYILTFNQELSQLRPEKFIEHFIVDLHIDHVVAGFDFSFGFKGAGNMENITSFGFDQFTTSVIDKVELVEEKISSTKIRASLQQGNFQEVNELLGRAYTVSGKVITGDKRGRLLGFPTANIEVPEQKLLPKLGVYAVKLEYEGIFYDGMANLGMKPTFTSDEVQPTLEVFIFDFDQDIYGCEVTVSFYSYIREEQKFNGVEEIVEQLKTDEKNIRAFFAS